MTTGVTSRQVEQYQSTGYVLLPEFVPQDEVKVLQKETERMFSDQRLVHQCNLRAQGRDTVEGGYVVDRLDPIIDISDSIRELATAPRTLAVLAQLMGEDVVLFKDKLIYKPPGANGYRTHQDYTYWVELPAPGQAILSLAVALDATSCENGATEFFPGCHHRHLLDSKTPEDVFHPEKGLIESAQELKQVEPELLPLQPGDAVAFSSLAPHGSGPNNSPGPRRQLFFTYATARYGDLYQKYYSLFHSYLRNDRTKDGHAEPYFA